jgi:hypothetical protein
MYANKGTAFDKEWIVERILSGNLKRMDLFLYAGHKTRADLVKECKVINSDVSEEASYARAVSCEDDRLCVCVNERESAR